MVLVITLYESGVNFMESKDKFVKSFGLAQKGDLYSPLLWKQLHAVYARVNELNCTNSTEAKKRLSIIASCVDGRLPSEALSFENESDRTQENIDHFNKHLINMPQYVLDAKVEFKNKEKRVRVSVRSDFIAEMQKWIEIGIKFTSS